MKPNSSLGNWFNQSLFLILSFQYLQPQFLGIDFDTEFLPYATFFLMCCSGIKLKKLFLKNHFLFNLLFILVLLLYGFILSGVNNYFSIIPLVTIFSPLICILLTLGLSKKYNFNPSNRTFLYCWVIWFIVLLVQYCFPNFYESISILFFKRNNFQVGGERGLSGISSEPSFAAEVLFLFFTIWRLKLSSFTIRCNVGFLVTYILAIVLNGSITMYGLLFMMMLIEVVVYSIYSITHQGYKLLSLIVNVLTSQLLRYTAVILAAALIVVITLGISTPFRILALLDYSSGDKATEPSISYLHKSSDFRSDINLFIYDTTLIKFGSWRTLGNYVGYHLSLRNFPFALGIGSASSYSTNSIFSSVMDELFNTYDSTLSQWLVTSFSYMPYAGADLGFLFIVLTLCWILRVTRTLNLLKESPLRGAIVISGLISILIISPKGSLSPWFVMIYGSSSFSGLNPITPQSK